MGRKREFDYEAAIEAATRVFWTKGYANTSLRDLLDAMGIGEGSFYNIFSGKRALYLECLRHYNNTVTARRIAALESTASVREGVHRFFSLVLRELSDSSNPPACLMANSLFSDVLVDDDLRKTVVHEFRTFEKHLRARLRAAVRSGELSESFAVEATAAILVTYLQGIFRTYPNLHERAAQKRQIEQLLSNLGL